MMATARSAEKEAFWRMVMEEHRGSGLTIKAFCKQQGISEPSFYAWRKKLNQRATDSITPGALVPVNLVDGQKSSASKLDSVTIRIATQSGFTVDIDGASADDVAGIAVELERQWRSMGDTSC
jgi:hypothetical protein